MFNILRNHFHRKAILNGLSRQRHLLHAGLTAIADVVEVKLTCIQVNDLIEIRLELGIHKPDGRVLMAESRTVVNKSVIPAAGQKLKIHFLPRDTAYILIMQAAC